MNTQQTILAQATQATQALQKTTQATQGEAPTLRYVLMNRPGYGNGKGALAAHTHAAFEALGLFAGEGVTREKLLRVWGQTAVKYHAEKFTAEDGLLYLNSDAIPLFCRSIDADLSEMFFELLTTGKTTRDACPNAYRAVKPV